MEIFIAGEKVTRPHKQLIIFKCHFFPTVESKIE